MLLKKFADFRFIQFFFYFRETYCGCLEDIPEPLREPNDDFLQLPMIPETKVSDIGRAGVGGGC